MKRTILALGLMFAAPAWADVVEDSEVDTDEAADTDAADDADSKGCNTAGIPGAMSALVGLGLLAGMRGRKSR